MDPNHKILIEILERVTRIECSVGVTATTLTRIEGKVEELDKRVDKLEQVEAANQSMQVSRVQADMRRDSRDDEMARDIRALSKHRWMVMGGLAVMGTVGTLMYWLLNKGWEQLKRLFG